MYSKVIRWTFTENSEWYYGTYGKWLFYILANIWVQIVSHGLRDKKARS